MANPIEIFQTKVTTAVDALALINGVFQWAFGPNEPSITFPFLNWADTGNDLWKQRKADDNGWIVRGRLSEAYFGLALADIVDPLGTVKEYYGSTLPERHLWVDGKTIGDAQSGATARANSDVYNLFAVLWDSVDNTNSQIKIYDSLGVLTEKGESAAADFAAHKRISLPDKRGRVGIGIDNMGGASANVVTDNKADIIGGIGGEEKHTQTEAELVSHRHRHMGGDAAGARIVSTKDLAGDQLATLNGDSNFWSDFCGAAQSIENTGGSQPFNIMQPWVACNYIMRY